MEDIAVRFGVPDDVHHVMDLAAMVIEENGLLKFSPAKVLREVWASLNNTGGVVGVIDGKKVPLEGAVLLRIDTMPYSDDFVLCERAVFVHPDFRGGPTVKGRYVGRAGLLVEFSKQVADGIGIPLLISILSTQRQAAKVRLYERHFGEPAGAYWLYKAGGVKTGHHDAAAE